MQLGKLLTQSKSKKHSMQLEPDHMELSLALFEDLLPLVQLVGIRGAEKSTKRIAARGIKYSSPDKKKRKLRKHSVCTKSGDRGADLWFLEDFFRYVVAECNTPIQDIMGRTNGPSSTAPGVVLYLDDILVRHRDYIWYCPVMIIVICQHRESV